MAAHTDRLQQALKKADEAADDSEPGECFILNVNALTIKLSLLLYTQRRKTI
jgi:hypothetical protein